MVHASLIVVLVLALFSCNNAPTPAPTPQPTQKRAERPQIDRRMVEKIAPFSGISGLSGGPEGSLWAVAENRPRLLRFTPSDDGPWVLQKPTFPIVNAPQHVDFEAITALDDDLFAIGTESGVNDRKTDLIAIVRLQGKQASVVGSAQFPYEDWDLRGTNNTGIEGVCAAGSSLLAASEVRGRQDGRRWAPLGVVDWRQAVAKTPAATIAWRHYKLMLSSDTGKISALACHEAAGKITVLAIERHYGISHLLRFTLPAEPGIIEPKVVLDLAPYFDAIPNLEGLVWDESGLVRMVSDNKYLFITGPTEIFSLVLPR